VGRWRATRVVSREVSNAGLRLVRLVRTHPLPQGGTDLMGPRLVSKKR
jgi:putative component of membrane protein insertase Oxa1/YidC/SpoIIIJ protein YidD